ncbi:MAG: ABC transporter permease, partial [Acidobacteriota bacterium]|nr:ABC transporter permease [Acidobacteriota bacterium]
MFRRKKRSLSDFDTEIQAHIDLEAEEFMRDGLDEKEARYAALRKFGNVTIAKERFYETGRWLWLDALVRDLDFACRILRKQSGTSFAIIGTLALAIGITAAVFTPINALIFTNLPYGDPDRLVSINGVGASSSEELIYFKQRTPFFEDIAGYSTTNANLLGAGEPVSVVVAQVTANFPKVMGAAPKAGRIFSASEQTSFSNEKLSEFSSAALIGEHLWRARFSSEPDIYGKSIMLNDRPFTIIGVLPSGFDYPAGAQVWTPTFHSPLELLRG